MSYHDFLINAYSEHLYPTPSPVAVFLRMSHVEAISFLSKIEIIRELIKKDREITGITLERSCCNISFVEVKDKVTEVDLSKYSLLYLGEVSDEDLISMVEPLLDDKIVIHVSPDEINVMGEIDDYQYPLLSHFNTSFFVDILNKGLGLTVEEEGDNE